MPNDQSQPEARDIAEDDESATPASEPAKPSPVAAKPPVPRAARPDTRPALVDDPPSAALATELSGSRTAVIEAIARWLDVVWEQPILRSLSANADRALEHVDTFPALRSALRSLQAGVQTTVETAVEPLLDPDGPMSDKVLANSVDAVLVQLAGRIGPPMIEAGLDPTSGGLERTHDGYRLKTLSEHDQVSAALREYSRLKGALAASRAEAVERSREQTRLEVTRLWQETA